MSKMKMEKGYEAMNRPMINYDEEDLNYLRKSPSPSGMSDCSQSSGELMSGKVNTQKDKTPCFVRTKVCTLVVLCIFCVVLFRHWHTSVVSQTLASTDEYVGESRQLPHCIVIGVRKCGTRALLEFLSLHPDINIAPDEVHFFDKQDRYDKGIEWYRSQMPLSAPGELTMEKSPAYFISSVAPQRVYHMNSTIKLLIILRDPVTRVLSDYTQVYTKRKARNETHSPLENLVIDSETGGINLRYKPIQISLYHQHWIRWRAQFNQNQFHIVDGDKLVKDPLSELLAVEKFLGIQSFLSEDNFYFNETRGFYCMRNENNNSRCLGSSKGRPHPPLDPVVMNKLKEFYRPHNELLYELVGKEFDWNL